MGSTKFVRRAMLGIMSLAHARAVALALAPDDRLALALELLESAEPEEPGVDDAWEAEIGRRVERLERGEVQLLSNDETLGRIGCCIGSRSRSYTAGMPATSW